MTEALKIVRLKRWNSKEEREKSPDWVNPATLGRQELIDLSSLCQKGGLRAEDFLRADKAGTIMFLAYRGESIVAFLSITLAVLPYGMRGHVNELRAWSNPMLGERFQLTLEMGNAILLLCNELGMDRSNMQTCEITESYRPTRSSEVKQAERFDEIASKNS